MDKYKLKVHPFSQRTKGRKVYEKFFESQNILPFQISLRFYFTVLLLQRIWFHGKEIKLSITYIYNY